MMEKIIAYIGLGSNMGDSEANVVKALNYLGKAEGIEITAVAPFYRTAPVGYTEQGYFVNTVAELKTSLGPMQLLETLQGIENRMGRVRLVRWGPRTLDLDILLYGGQVIAGQNLDVPHPRMHERAFVMVPLADINPNLMIKGEKAVSLARRLAREQHVEKISQN